MRHINPTPEMWRQPRPDHDYFNAPKRDGHNPDWSEPGDPSGHDGCDCYSVRGTPAVATESGPIHWAGRKVSNWGAGKFVEIHHPADFPDAELSRYLHLSEILVTKGQWVEKGQTIGLVGCTGQCRTAHVHYGLMRLVGGYDPAKSGLWHVKRGGAVWLDPILEGILTNTPDPPEPPQPPVTVEVTRPVIDTFGPPYKPDGDGDVKDAQASLASRGHLPWEGNHEDGVWDGKPGPLTQAGVESFQVAEALPVTRILDGPTWQRLLSSP